VKEWEGWVTLGVVAGLAALLRQTVLFWLPMQLAWIAWAGNQAVSGQQSDDRAGSWRRWLTGSLVTLVIAGLIVLPWTARNYLDYHTFLPLNSNAGFAFYSANHPDHGTHFDQDYAAPLPQDLLGQGLNEAQWNTALARRGFEFIVQDPWRYFLLTLSKAAVQFNFWFSAQSSRSANLMRLLSFGLYLPFFIAGLILSWRNWQRASLIYLFVIGFNLLHILTWAGIRYRLPVDAALMPFAAYALIRLYRALFHRRKPLPA